MVAGTGYKEGRLTVDLDTLGPANPGLVGVLRLHPDGTPDATFDGDGVMTFGNQAVFDFPPTPVSDLVMSAADVTVDAAGRVFLAGQSVPLTAPWALPFTTGTPATLPAGLSRPFAARLTAAGGLDPAFGSGGVVPLIPGFANGAWVALRTPGRGRDDRRRVRHRRVRRD